MTDAYPVLVRTSFTSPAAWAAVVRGFTTPSPDGFLPNVGVVEDRAFERMSAASVLAELPDGHRSVVFVADEVTETSGELLVLAIRPASTPVQSFRLTPANAWSVENNLTLCNMDWEDFMRAVGPDGVFRGF
jgi:hypothetical protein